jgi:hypothetical protein
LIKYTGGCHCGQVAFTVIGDLDQTEECTCSICRMKGFLHLIVPVAQFELVQGADALATYTFGTGVAKHHFCRFCGISAFYIPRSDPDKVDVNARCLNDVDVAAIRPRLFDGRNWETAMKNRPGQAVAAAADAGGENAVL